jgi:hypothetical protein
MYTGESGMCDIFSGDGGWDVYRVVWKVGYIRRERNVVNTQRCVEVGIYETMSGR